MRSPNDAVTAGRAIGGQFLENSPQGRHVRRLSVIWIFGGVVIGGNVLDWLGVMDWGPTQHRSPDWIWVNASAAMFWLALAMLAVSLHDVVSVWVHGPKQPPWEDLPDVGPVRRTSNRIRKWSTRHNASIGLAAVAVGGLFGHFLWHVGP